MSKPDWIRDDDVGGKGNNISIKANIPSKAVYYEDGYTVKHRWAGTMTTEYIAVDVHGSAIAAALARAGKQFFSWDDWRTTHSEWFTTVSNEPVIDGGSITRNSNIIIRITPHPRQGTTLPQSGLLNLEKT